MNQQPVHSTHDSVKGKGSEGKMTDALEGIASVSSPASPGVSGQCRPSASKTNVGSYAQRTPDWQWYVTRQSPGKDPEVIATLPASSAIGKDTLRHIAHVLTSTSQALSRNGSSRRSAFLRTQGIRRQAVSRPPAMLTSCLTACTRLCTRCSPCTSRRRRGTAGHPAPASTLIELTPILPRSFG